MHSRSYSVRRPRTRTEHVFAAKKEGDGKRVAVEGGSAFLLSFSLSRSSVGPLATLSRRAIPWITSAASGQEMKIAPTLFNLDKSICCTGARRVGEKVSVP